MAKLPLLCVALQIPNRANGGIESFTQMLGSLTRYDPVVVTNVDNERSHRWREMGIETHVVPERASGQSFKAAPTAHLKACWDYGRVVNRLLRGIRSAPVYVNDPLAMQFLYPLAAAGRIRTLFALRNMPDPGLRQSPAKYRALFNSCRHLLFLSNDMADRWGRFTGGFKPPCSVTYSIVDPTLFDQRRERARSEPFVLVPARITPSKRQLEFLRYVAPGLVQAGLTVVIAGDANAADAAYEQDCRAAAEPLGDAVRFLGYQKDLRELYSGASVIVVAARLEGLARAMIEGLVCGCPVVTFDVWSAEEVLSDGGGIVVPGADWQQMQKDIVALCADDNRLAEAGLRARETAMRLFNGKDVIARYERAFDLAAQEASPE